jgi:hypothetical protein
MFQHFGFSAMLCTFCMVPAKFPLQQRFLGFKQFLGGPHKHIKLGFTV